MTLYVASVDFADEPRVGDVRGAKQIWRLASLAQSSGAPVTKWATGKSAKGSYTSGFTAWEYVSASAGKAAVAQYSAHYCHLRNLRSLNSFSRLQEMSGLKEKAATVLWRWIPPLTTANRAKLFSPDAR